MWQRSLKNLRVKGRESADRKHRYLMAVCECRFNMPSLQGFIARTRRVDNIKLYFAEKRGTLNKHLSKLEKLINII